MQSEISTYARAGHLVFGNSNPDMLEENPLLLLARTCQKIGCETKNSGIPKLPIIFESSITSSSKMLPGNNVAPNSGKDFSPSSMSSIKQSIDYSYSKKRCYRGIDAEISPSSISLVQLAKLSSSLYLNSDRQKRGIMSHTRQSTRHNRVRKTTLHSSSSCSSDDGLINEGKPVDYTTNTFANSLSRSVNSSASASPLSVSSPTNIVSPAICLQTPPSDATNVPKSENPSKLLHDSLSKRSRELIFTLTQNLINRVKYDDNQPSTDKEFKKNNDINGFLKNSYPEPENQCIPQNYLQASTISRAHSAYSGTQCLYCGLVCFDVSSLVLHIYSHLASLHNHYQLPDPKSIQDPPHIISDSLLDTMRYYESYMQNRSLFENASAIDDFHNSNFLPEFNKSPPSTVLDRNSLFSTWLNIFHSNYRKALSR